MQLVEQHIIDRHDPRFAAIDPACFASKNLYNATLYILRQAFFAHEHVPNYAQLAHSLKDHPRIPGPSGQGLSMDHPAGVRRLGELLEGPGSL